LEAMQSLYPATRNNTGPKALQVIRTYLVNIIEQPSALKFRVINKSNKVFNQNVTKVQGALAIFKSAGFVLEQDDRYRLREVNLPVLKRTIEKIERALEVYR
jgi:hypothetical protein